MIFVNSYSFQTRCLAYCEFRESSKKYSWMYFLPSYLRCVWWCKIDGHWHYIPHTPKLLLKIISTNLKMTLLEILVFLWVLILRTQSTTTIINMHLSFFISQALYVIILSFLLYLIILLSWNLFHLSPSHQIERKWIVIIYYILDYIEFNYVLHIIMLYGYYN